MAIDPRGPPTARAPTRRLLKIAREEGPRSLWFKLLGETVYRRLTLYELPLGAGAPAFPAPKGVSIGLLDAAAIDEYRAFRPDSETEEVLARLRSEDLCFVSRLEGRLVHVSWIARQSMWSWYLRRHIPLGRDEACTFETFTEPLARGRGIGAAQRAYMADHLRDAGCRRLLATIYPENQMGIRLVEKVGYRRIGTVGYLSAGSWRRDFCLMREGERAPGLEPD